MDSEVIEGSKSQAEGSKKRTREELESDNSKKQKIDENVEAKVDDEAEMKKHMEIVPDDEVAIDAIPLATKSPVIVDWKIIKEGKMGYFQLIRADGSSRRPEEAYERVLWGDLKVMFEPDVESEVWRNLQGYNVTVWKLFSSSGVHFVRFQNLHIFMLVEKKYPLTPATITKMLNKKLQTDHWNEMCYQLLKLMTKQHKNPGKDNIFRTDGSSFHNMMLDDEGFEVNIRDLFIWGLETFSNSIQWWRKNENVIPHGVEWTIEMNELWWRSSLEFFKRVTPSTPVLRSATRGSSNSKSVHTHVRTEVRHEVHVCTEVSRVVDKEEVHVLAVDKEDVHT
ncbi:hypothetical protein Tco_0981797 [Tanacetum coccineum]